MPDYGYSRVTMRDLAHQAGTGLSTAYHHFASKELIAVHLVTRGVEAVHAAMQAFMMQAIVMDASGTRHRPHADCLRDMLIARVMLRHEQSRRQRHPINENTPELKEALGALRAGWRDQELALLQTAIKYGQGASAFIAGSPSQLAQALLWATDSLVTEALLPSSTGMLLPPLNMPLPALDKLLFSPEQIAFGKTESSAPGKPSQDSKLFQDSKPSQDSKDELSDTSRLADKITHVAKLLVSGLEHRSL